MAFLIALLTMFSFTACSSSSENEDEIEEKNMNLDIDIPDGSVIKEIDEAEFSRVLQNLFSNAIKHNEEGTKILVSLKKEKNIC